MSDDNRFAMTRRSAMESLGTAGVAGLGGYLLTTDETVDASVIEDAPIDALPGMSYGETIRSSNHDADGALEQHTDSIVRRGIKLVNVRLYDSDDMARDPCGDAPGIEYRFVVSGISKSIVRNWNADRQRFELEPPHALGELVTHTEPMLSVQTGSQCGPASLQSHYTDLYLADQNVVAWFLPGDEAATTDDEALDRIGDVPVDRKMTYLGVADSFDDLRQEASRFQFDSPTYRSGKVLFGSLDYALDAITLVDTIFGDTDSEPDISHDNNAITIKGGNRHGLFYICDFTVMVPADADSPTTVDVEQSFDFVVDGAGDIGSYGYLENEVNYEIEIPPNDPAEGFEALDLPRYKTLPEGEGTETPSAKEQSLEYAGPRLSAVPDRPDVGEPVQFALDATPGVDPSEDRYSVTWTIDGTEYEGIAPPEHAFETAGEYTAVCEVSDDPDGSLEHDVTYTRTVTVGPETHIRPVAAFTAPRTPDVGTTVRLNAASSDTNGHDASYEWTIREYPTGSGSPETRTGEIATFDVESDTDYHVELVLRDDNGLTDTETMYMYPDQTPVAETDVDGALHVGDEVTFDAAGSTPTVGEIVSYRWTIVDPPENAGGRAAEIATGDGSTITHAFSATTEYIVSVVVENSQGLVDNATRRVVPEPVPDADIEVSVSDPNVDETVTFDASGSKSPEGEITRYSWEVVDPPASEGGQESVVETYTGETATHEFQASTEYHVRLAVTNDEQLTGRESTTITVGTSSTATPDDPNPTETTTSTEPEPTSTPTESPGPEPIGDGAPADSDGDGLYEDVNGDGATNLADAGDLFLHRDSAAVQDHVDAYDFSGNSKIDLADVVALFQENVS